jgi:hypothetical protein
MAQLPFPEFVGRVQITRGRVKPLDTDVKRFTRVPPELEAGL